MKFISFRRHLLDKQLNGALPLLKGRILDVGGSKKKRRGFFKVPAEIEENWIVLNNDESVNPEINAELPQIPSDTDSFECVVMTEVVEYIWDTGKLLEEIHRVLKPSGQAFISSPFIHTFHGDYQSDYYRYTESFFKKIFEGKFEIIAQERMGGVLVVSFDLFLSYFSRRNCFASKICTKLIKASSSLVLFLDKRFFKENFSIHTGFWFHLKKI